MTVAISFDEYYQRRSLSEMFDTNPTTQAHATAAQAIEQLHDVLRGQMPNAGDLLGKVRQAQQILQIVGTQLNSQGS